MPFQRRTTFIIGAGASFEFDLPLGTGLRTSIGNRMGHFTHVDHLTGDEPLVLAIQGLKGTRAEVIDAAAEARAALPIFDSVDDFLLQFSGKELVGSLCRLVIAETILAAEARSKLRLAFDGDPASRGYTHDEIRPTWLGQLVKKAIFKAGSPDRAIENLSFIVFNYDRCIESYLIAGLRDGFAISTEDAAELTSRIPMLHVYGDVGQLPQLSDGVSGVAFGESRVDLARIAARIRTYGEGLAGDDHAKSVAGLVQTAEQLVFLGYAFHPQGMAILFPDGTQPQQRAYGTAFQNQGALPGLQALFGDGFGAFPNEPGADFCRAHLSTLAD